MERVKKPVSVLAEEIEEAKFFYKIQEGKTFCHQKSGDLYVVRDIAVDCKSNALMVVYCKVVAPNVSFTRPLSQWVEIPEGKDTPRFVLVE